MDLSPINLSKKSFKLLYQNGSIYSPLISSKMKRSTWLPAILVLLILCPVHAFAQDETPETYRVLTTDGNEFIGQIIEETETDILIRTEQYGDMRIERSKIRRISVIRQETLVEGVYWPDNPQSTRYFWAPNGYSMGQGEVYYQNIWVLYNQVSIGVSDVFSFSIGTIPLFLFGAGVVPVWVVPKVSIPIESDRIQVGAGAFLGAILGESEFFGIAFGSTTFGSRDRNTSIALGWGFTGDGWANSPLVNISFMARTSPRGYFLSENYLMPMDGDLYVILSAGGRRIIGNGLGLDFGLFLPLGRGIGFFALPFLGITVPMSN
jgi:hypothetical protein